jgi:hypothetical protein
MSFLVSRKVTRGRFSNLLWGSESADLNEPHFQQLEHAGLRRR